MGRARRHVARQPEVEAGPPPPTLHIGMERGAGFGEGGGRCLRAYPPAPSRSREGAPDVGSRCRVDKPPPRPSTSEWRRGAGFGEGGRCLRAYPPAPSRSREGVPDVGSRCRVDKHPPPTLHIGMERGAGFDEGRLRWMPLVAIAPNNGVRFCIGFEGSDGSVGADRSCGDTEQVSQSISAVGML